MLFLIAEYLIGCDLPAELESFVFLSKVAADVLLGWEWHVEGSLVWYLLTAQIIQVLVISRVLACSLKMGGDLDWGLLNIVVITLRLAAF